MSFLIVTLSFPISLPFSEVNLFPSGLHFQTLSMHLFPWMQVTKFRTHIKLQAKITISINGRCLRIPISVASYVSVEIFAAIIRVPISSTLLWRHNFPLKCRYIYTRLHGVLTQNAAILAVNRIKNYKSDKGRRHFIPAISNACSNFR
jgi:hypothetical protein